MKINAPNLKYDHSNEKYAPDAKDLGLAINMNGFYTEDELREQLAKLVEANSFAGQGRLEAIDDIDAGGEYTAIEWTVNGVAKRTSLQFHYRGNAIKFIQQVTGRYGEWAVIPAGRSIEELK